MNILVRGLGLAGCWMVHELLKHNHTVTAYDANTHQMASLVAAGLINPTTGSRPKPTWKGPTLLPYAKNVYQELEREHGVNIWRDRIIRRVFLTARDAELWNNAVSHGVGVEWSKIYDEIDGVRAPFGAIEYSGATVDTEVFLSLMMKRFRALSIVAEQDPSNEEFDLVVWCQGWEAVNNPLWNWLPFQPVKGEILDAHVDGPILDAVYLRGVWIIPYSNNRVKIGSTHNWDDLDDKPSVEGRDVLIERASNVLHGTITVTGHQAAVRPAMKSKRPVLGIHPASPKNAILNGLGSKGTLWAPWAAKMLAEHISSGIEIDSEVDINRWWNNDV